MSKKLTRLGYQRLSQEYEELMFDKRPKVVKGIGEAAAEGDRSENAEYIYGKKHLREIDKRLHYLGLLLKKVHVIDPIHQSVEQVNFGCTVTIQDDSGVSKKYKIVGEGETDFYPGSISDKSPVAHALLGKKEGDVVQIHRPKGVWEVEILEISVS